MARARCCTRRCGRSSKSPRRSRDEHQPRRARRLPSAKRRARQVAPGRLHPGNRAGVLRNLDCDDFFSNRINREKGREKIGGGPEGQPDPDRHACAGRHPSQPQPRRDSSHPKRRAAANIRTGSGSPGVRGPDAQARSRRCLLPPMSWPRAIPGRGDCLPSHVHGN